MMSVTPQAVWNGGRLSVKTGFIMENFGRMQSASAAVFSRVFSFVTMALGEPSLPEAAMVSTTPTGRAISHL